MTWNPDNCLVVWGYIEPPRMDEIEEPLTEAEETQEAEIEYECKEKICSPFPGLIKNRLVAEGARVSKNQSVVILEALKMDNDLIAPCDGKIHFLVKEYTQVTADQLIAVIK